MTPQELHRLLENDVISVVQYLLPNGKQEGREWRVGSVTGEKGHSLAVRIDGDKIGVWSDFANGDRGDLFELWKQVRGISFVDTLKEVKEYLGVNDSPGFKQPKRKLPEKPKCHTANDKMIKWFEDRGIFKSAITRLKVGQQGNAIMFPYISPDGELELVKYRDMDQKKFWSNKDPIPCLFGWQAVEDDHRDIVICEGENDALTFWQQGVPALSVPKGAGGGDKQSWIEYEYDRLERFDNIYICMDSDSAGQDAVAEIIDRLGRHRCKVVDLTYGLNRYKDPNEANLDGVVLQDFLDRAKTIDPEELKRLAEFHNDIMAELDPERKQADGIKLPWQKTFDKIRLRDHEVSIVAGCNGHGKSAVVSHLLVDAVSQGRRGCVASMELPARKFGAKLYQQVGGVSYPAQEQAAKIKQFVDDNVFVFNTYGTAKASRILEVFEYARRRYGVTLFILDSLSKTGLAEDDYDAQKKVIDQLFDFALETGVHVLLVVHVRKGKTEEEPPNKLDIKGSGAITDAVSNVFIVWRNKVKERFLKSDNEADREKAKGEYDTRFSCHKQRETGEEPSYGLWFHPQSCQFFEKEGAEPKRYTFDSEAGVSK